MPDISTFLRQSSLTYADVEADIYRYIDNLPEGSKPKDLFRGSEGKLIIDQLAACHSDMAYKIIVGFCESYLLYANKIEDIIANAESKGYNVSRGENATVLCTFIPDSSSTISYLDQIGTVDEYGLYSLESKTLVSGVATTIKAVIGTLNTLSYTVLNVNELVYRFTSSNISDDIRIRVDGETIEFSTEPMRALYGYLVAMTNSFGSVDLLDFSHLSSLSSGITQVVYTGPYQYVQPQVFKYNLSGTFYYTSEELSEGVIVYTDETLTNEFGKVTFVDNTTVNIEGDEITYSGPYMLSIDYYEYLFSNIPYYLSGPIEPGLYVYTDSSLTEIYGIVDTVYTDTSNVIIRSVTSVDQIYTVNAGSVIELDYIELDNISYSNLSGEFNLGELTNIVQVSSYREPEEAVEIQKNTIIHEQTRNVLVARRDAKKLIKLYLPGKVETNDYDFAPGVIGVTYTLNSGLPLSEREYEDLTNYLSESRVMGIPMPIIIPSTNASINLTTSVVTTQIINKDLLQTNFDSVFHKYEKDPGITIDFDVVEHKLESFDSVQNVRFSPVESEIIEGEYFNLGSFIVVPEISSAFVAVRYAYYTGSEEPSWPTTLNDTVTDGDLIFKTIKYASSESSWVANSSLEIGQTVNPTTYTGYSYQVVGYLNYTGSSQPAGEGYDGDVMWKITSYDPSAPLWSANSLVNYGDIVNITTSTVFSLIASDFRRKITEEPNWSDYHDKNTMFNDNNCYWRRIPMDGNYIALGAKLKLPWNTYLTISQTIK